MTSQLPWLVFILPLEKDATGESGCKIFMFKINVFQYEMSRIWLLGESLSLSLSLSPFYEQYTIMTPREFRSSERESDWYLSMLLTDLRWSSRIQFSYVFSHSLSLSLFMSAEPMDRP